MKKLLYLALIFAMSAQAAKYTLYYRDSKKAGYPLELQFFSGEDDQQPFHTTDVLFNGDGVVMTEQGVHHIDIIHSPKQYTYDKYRVYIPEGQEHHDLAITFDPSSKKEKVTIKNLTQRQKSLVGGAIPRVKFLGRE